MSKQKLTTQQKRDLFFVLPGWNVKLHTSKIVTFFASKIIPGATDRIKVTRFLCLSISHTHAHTQTLPGALWHGQI